jgi:hypothetical protein
MTVAHASRRCYRILRRIPGRRPAVIGIHTEETCGDLLLWLPFSSVGP